MLPCRYPRRPPQDLDPPIHRPGFEHPAGSFVPIAQGRQGFDGVTEFHAP
jgi:hypothetical protein